MNLALSPQVEKIITDHVKSGRFVSPEDVVTAAISSLDQPNSFGDFAPGELNELLAVGDADIENGDVLGIDEVFDELRRRNVALRQTAQEKKSAASPVGFPLNFWLCGNPPARQ